MTTDSTREPEFDELVISQEAQVASLYVVYVSTRKGETHSYLRQGSFHPTKNPSTR